MPDVMVITVHRDDALLHRFDVPEAAQGAIIAAMQTHRKAVEFPKVVRDDGGKELGTARTKAEETELLRAAAAA